MEEIQLDNSEQSQGYITIYIYMLCGKGGISKSDQMITKLIVIMTKGDEKKRGE